MDFRAPKFCLVGSRRSQKARESGVRVEDDAFLGKRVRAALQGAGIHAGECRYVGLFEPGGWLRVKAALRDRQVIVGITKQVQAALSGKEIPHRTLDRLGVAR